MAKRLRHVEETHDVQSGELLTVSKTFSVKANKSEEFFFTFLSALNAISALSSASDLKILSMFCAIAEFNTGKVLLSKDKREDIAKKLDKVQTTMIHKAILTEDEFIIAYLRLWNGGIGLTQKELDILFFFIKKLRKYEKDKVPGAYIDDMLFNNDNISDLKKELNMSNSNWGNYKAAMLSKKVLIEKDDQLLIIQMLIPKLDVHIQFEIKED